MPSKIALHCHRAGPDIDAAIARAPWAAVKALNDSAPLATARAHGIPVRILRLYGIETLSDSDAVNRWLQQDLSAASHLQLVCEDGKGYDAQWQGAIINGLRPHFGGTFLIGGFPTGNPKDYDSKDHTKSDGTWTHADGTPHFPALLPLVPLLQHPDVALGVDEYTSILSTDPRWNGELEWMPARYELLHHCLEVHGASPNVVILESGADDGEPAPSKTGSWTGRGWSAADYLTTLEALDSLDQQAPYVVCRCVFTLGADSAPQWRPYEIAPIIPQLAAYVQSQEGPQMPTTAVPGFDVSSYQGQIDWGRAAAAGKFVGVKVSEGVYPNGVPLV
ncbi:MAG: hypothetical protein KGL35_03145, partial [Bradyrhizobium sp.]|nr:hypothetical protein [Bradyrhizobium sp.]